MKCVNCGSRFNQESHAPRMLGCGHSFCHSCISTLFKCGQINCPTCGHKHCANEVNDVTLNRVVLDFVMEEKPVQELRQESLCAFHKQVLRSFCKNCGDCTCEDCYDSLHDTGSGCEEVCISSENANLEKDSIVKNLDDKVKILTPYLNQVQEELGDSKQFESALKECLRSLTHHRSSLEVQYQSLKDQLSILESSKSSLQECGSSSDFLHWCKSSPFFNNHLQITRNREPLCDLTYSQSICKTFSQVLIASLHGSSIALQGGESGLCLSLFLEDQEKMINLFKEIHIKKHLTKVRLTWYLDGNNDNPHSKSVFADIELNPDMVEDFYKFFSYGMNAFTTTYSHNNVIQLHKHYAEVCIWQRYFDNGDFIHKYVEVNNFSGDSVIGLPTGDPPSDIFDRGSHFIYNMKGQFPVLAVVSGGVISGLVFVKYPANRISSDLRFIGTCYKIGGNVEDMRPENTKCSAWRLNLRI